MIVFLQRKMFINVLLLSTCNHNSWLLIWVGESHCRIASVKNSIGNLHTHEEREKKKDSHLWCMRKKIQMFQNKLSNFQWSSYALRLQQLCDHDLTQVEFDIYNYSPACEITTSGVSQTRCSCWNDYCKLVASIDVVDVAVSNCDLSLIPWELIINEGDLSIEFYLLASDDDIIISSRKQAKLSSKRDVISINNETRPSVNPYPFKLASGSHTTTNWKSFCFVLYLRWFAWRQVTCLAVTEWCLQGICY